MNNGKSLIIWNKNGSTMKFEKVTNFKNAYLSSGELRISFDYFGVSTQVKRNAVFFIKSIAGYALEREEA
ncbi:hypothetical protein ACF3OA_13320 [Enterococcus thailandicus]|uniref:hypothetical protein n=1 Tax=Enterococcus thailandicus TaxID=417368 RepID=UPI0037529598